MKIIGINCIVPSNKIDNIEIQDLVSYYSKSIYNGDIRDLGNKINQLLENSGLETRYWRSGNERPIDFIYQSYLDVLRESGVSKQEIDTIIYTGIDRGFIEPANACFVAKKLGLNNVRTFDIVDACMGWCTAMQIAQALLNNGDAKLILIVSSEFPMDKGGIIFPKNFKIKNDKELAWKFPAFTIGEAVSTTLVNRSNNVWKFNHYSDSSKVDLCTIPLYKFREYSETSSKLKNKKQFVFSAYGRELYFAGYKHAIDILVEGLKNMPIDPVAILPHSVSLSVPNRVAEQLNIKDKIFTTFPMIGNVATSSIPAHIYYGLLQKKFHAGDYLLGWIASGGLKYSSFDIFI